VTSYSDMVWWRFGRPCCLYLQNGVSEWVRVWVTLQL